MIELGILQSARWLSQEVGEPSEMSIRLCRDGKIIIELTASRDPNMCAISFMLNKNDNADIMMMKFEKAIKSLKRAISE